MVGAIYAPAMSALLLTLVIYDYDDCTELSEVIPVELAIDIISTYSVVILFFVIFAVVIWFLRRKKNKQ